jgi:hypothetical protein
MDNWHNNKILELDDKEFDSLLKLVSKKKEAYIVMISENNNIDSLIQCGHLIDDNGKNYEVKANGGKEEGTIKNLFDVQMEWDWASNGEFNKVLSVNKKWSWVGENNSLVYRETEIDEVSYYNDHYGQEPEEYEPQFYETELSKVCCFIADYGERNVKLDGYGHEVGRPSLVAIRKSITTKDKNNDKD